MLEARDVHKRHGDTIALAGVTLMVAEAECVAIVGESGSGKTTLLRAFNRMVDVDRGVVRVGDVDVAQADPIELRRHIGYVPQEGGLLPHWRVLRNVGLVPWLNHAADARAAAADALRLTGLDPDTFGERWPAQLSGGQRQRVAIARAIAARPSVLLLDEAFTALDAITRSEVYDAFVAARSQVTTTTLMVTHDLREAARLADRMVVLRQGRIEQDAACNIVIGQPATSYVAKLVERSGLS